MSLFTSTFDPPGGAGSPGLFPKPNALAGPSRPGPVRKPNGAAQPTGKRPRDAVDGQRRPIHHARSDGKSRSKSVRPSMQQKSDAGEHRGLQKAERNLQKVVKTVHVAPKDSAGHMGNGKTKKRKLPASTGLDDRVHSKPRQELGVQMPSSMNSVAEIPLPHRLKNGTKHITGGLTDMQRGMQEKLEGARFRWINEQLYATTSNQAVDMMQRDPKIFTDYHMTHRALTSAWPSPPLDHILALLEPLPHGTVIVDLGCGEAGLAKRLVPQGKVVLSYDLVASAEGWVVEADFFTHVPLPGRAGGGARAADAAEQGLADEDGACEAVDVVVCCLSLMGTNWVGGVCEACRILKQGGTLHIAEVTSRFGTEDAFVDAVKSFGFTLDKKTAPSTHFTLFRFTKQSAVPLGPVRGEKEWVARVKAGEAILKPCVYKKR